MRDSAHRLTDLVDVGRLQTMCDDLSEATGMVLAVLDPEGDILVASGWQDICTQFHRSSESGLIGCVESDTTINRRLAETISAPEHIEYKCANGLWDVAFPLVVAGEHLANVFTGQFFYDDDDVDIAEFRQRAQRFGFDETAYLEALARVPILSHERVEQTVSFLGDFVGVLADLGLSAMRLERERETLRESAERYRSLFQNMTEGVALHELVVDELGAPVDYRVLAVNPAYTRQTGLSVEHVCGKLATEAYGTEQPPYFEEFTRTALTGEPTRLRVYFEPLSRHFDITVIRQSDNRFATLFEDVTERMRAEERVRELNAELEQRVLDRTAQLAAKNDELKSFAYTVSHDLKAPLRGIAGYADELDRRHREGLGERADFCVTQILTATRNMDRLIEDMLRYSRMDAETASLTEVDIRGAIETILRDRRSIIDEQHIVVTLDLPFATLRAWERGLAQVLSNLIDNAIKFSRDADPPRLGIGGTESDAAWTLSVSDNGVGFDMKYHDRIFGLFNRLVRAEEFEGTGAGLAIAKKVLDKEGGRLWAESAPGQGATFFVELPKRDGTEPRF